MIPKILLTTSERFDYPLSSVNKKRYKGMSKFAEHYVLGLSESNRCQYFEEHAHFYLFPSKLPGFILRPIYLVFVFFFTIYSQLRWGIHIVITLGTYDGFPVILASRCLGLLKRRVVTVVQVHGDWETAPLILRKYPLFFKPLLSRVGIFTLRNADIIRTISDSTSKKTRKVTEKPIVSFPAFTDIDMFMEDYPLKSSSGKTKTILYAGVLTRLKGVHNLIDTLEKLVKNDYDLRLVIAGEGPYKSNLKEQIAKLNLNEQIEFLGHLDQTALRKYYRRCDIFVLPSLSEGFGRVIIEAMACGKPVIASAIGGVPELIKNNKTGLLVQPGNVEDIATKIEHLLKNEKLRVEIGKRGKGYVKDTYSNEKFFEKYRELLELAEKIHKSYR